MKNIIINIIDIIININNIINSLLIKIVNNINE